MRTQSFRCHSRAPGHRPGGIGHQQGWGAVGVVQVAAARGMCQKPWRWKRFRDWLGSTINAPRCPARSGSIGALKLSHCYVPSDSGELKRTRQTPLPSQNVGRTSSISCSCVNLTNTSTSVEYSRMENPRRSQCLLASRSHCFRPSV
jgi:hypothetical protein